MSWLLGADEDGPSSAKPGGDPGAVEGGRGEGSPEGDGRTRALAPLLVEVAAQLEGVARIEVMVQGLEPMVGMLQSLEQASARADKQREQQIAELRAHTGSALDRLAQAVRVEAAQKAAVDVFKAIVPALDDIDHVLRDAGAAGDGRGAQALRIIQRKLKDAFARLGVTEIPVEERVTKFDAGLHQAHAWDGDPESARGLAPDTVVRLERAGYRAGDQVLRAALVSIVTAPASASA